MIGKRDVVIETSLGVVAVEILFPADQVAVTDEDPEYLVSLTDEETSRVLSLDIQSDPEGNILMISGGRELKMWKRCLDTNNRGEDDVVVRGRVGHMFTDGGLTTGASESEMSEDEMISSFNEANNRTAVLEKKSGFCNCSLM